MQTILVTGGLGYIGSHTTVQLLEENYNVIIIDDLSNSQAFVLDRIEKITGKRPVCYNYDMKNKSLIQEVFQEHSIDGVIHFAAYKAVGESVEKPLMYYQNNNGSLLNLLEVMQENNVNHIVFSSSATVYGDPTALPLTEQSELKPPASVYASTKLMGEQILKDSVKANSRLKAIILRYFNPVGAHFSALIGELPQGPPNNLMPYITQTAAGIREQLTIFGNDYDTPDGTCVRDYIHVVDLADAHIAAINRLNNPEESVEIYNIGTGKGLSVLEVVNSFETVNQLKLNYKYGKRRSGDVPCYYADASLAEEKLNWKAKLGIEDMVRSSWEFQKTLNSKT